MDPRAQCGGPTHLALKLLAITMCFVIRKEHISDLLHRHEAQDDRVGDSTFEMSSVDSDSESGDSGEDTSALVRCEEIEAGDESGNRDMRSDSEEAIESDSDHSSEFWSDEEVEGEPLTRVDWERSERWMVLRDRSEPWMRLGTEPELCAYVVDRKRFHPLTMLQELEEMEMEMTDEEIERNLDVASSAWRLLI
ncbi:hypothetical protein HKX48_000162 [Thoreauomyces humboldtii]|nr:hypothetical protein HKX48_000162 [Thoreauomyces humboldtii]